MITVRIEHPIKSFQAWKAAFDRDPVDRKRSDVRHYQVLQPLDDPQFIMINLDFDTLVEATCFLDAMRRVWATPQATPALGGAPRVTIVQAIETVTL